MFYKINKLNSNDKLFIYQQWKQKTNVVNVKNLNQ